MKSYDKEAFLAGYKSAFEMRGIKPAVSVIPFCRSVYFEPGFEYEKRGKNSFTLKWKTNGYNHKRQGIIFIPNLFPITLTAETTVPEGRETGEVLRWGWSCPYDMDYDYLESHVKPGGGISYSQGLPNMTRIIDNPYSFEPNYVANKYNMNCVFCVDCGEIAGSTITLHVDINK